MPPTKTKAYTPGAERAAREIASANWTLTELANIISARTHDAEMLEALKAIVRQHKNNGIGGILIVEAEAIIAKVEGR